MKRHYDWHFPLPRTHTGMLLGNAITGAMIWGGGNVLCVTLGRADYWDHRGGKDWTPAMNYGDIRRLLEAGDEEGLRKAFEQVEQGEGEPRRPSVLPVGRLELRFPEGFTLERGRVQLGEGVATVTLRDAAGATHEVTLEMAAKRPLLLVECGGSCPEVTVAEVTSWAYVGDYLRGIGFQEPVAVGAEGYGGWVQARPADPALAVVHAKGPKRLWVAVCQGEGRETASAEAAGVALIGAAREAGPAALRRERARWWTRYWSKVPVVDVPNERLRTAYEYGMYKFAGLTAPHGVAATLQGPWIEEYQMPPWSSDYHFNINVQECYWPAYQGNLLEHTRPMLDMVWGWREKLRENARLFVGIEDGYLLPHAVDDTGRNMGGFWTGTIDHGCTAWVAKMMYDYWLYGGDVRFLRETAYPFMVGAMRVYEEMLEREGDGFVLPVSVSPEYRGSRLDAWGRNASFQLAAIHWLVESLQRAAEVLGVEPRPIWAEIERGLPKACVGHAGGYATPQIMLWEGTPLEESHRHHSHLAGIYPFDVIDVESEEWADVMATTFRWWMRQGSGQWTGWCVPWAAMLAARIGIPEVSESLLEYWERLFTNEGRGTLHDPLTWWEKPLPEQRGRQEMPIGNGFGMSRREVMQIEAGMAAAAAVLDLLVHVRRGVHHLFPGAPKSWRNCAFAGVRTEGGFLVSARRRDGALRDVRVVSTVGGAFRLRNPWGEGEAEVTLKGKRVRMSGPTIEVALAKGEGATLRAAR